MLPLLSSGPTSVRAALDALGWPAHTRALDGSTLPPAARPEQTLATLLGLTGAVSLADHLDRVQHRPRPTPDAQTAEADAATHRLVSEKIARRRAGVHERIERRYRAAFTGRDALPDAEAMWAVLAAEAALPERAPERLAAVAARLQQPFRQHLAAQLAIVRKEQRFLREDVHAALAPRSAYGRGLISLDAQLEPSLAVMLQARHARALDGVCQRFAQRLLEALMALPDDTGSAAALGPWFERRGWASRFVTDCQRLCLSLLDAECAAVQSLVDAACGPLAPTVATKADRADRADRAEETEPGAGAVVEDDAPADDDGDPKEKP